MMPSTERPPGSEHAADLTASPPEPIVSLDVSAARAVADLLEMLGELPSTPTLLATVSTSRAGDVARLLPAGSGPAGHGHGSVDVSASLLVSVAGLLQRLGELTSTPPVVADDARAWAAQLWERLEDSELPAGHRPEA